MTPHSEDRGAAGRLRFPEPPGMEDHSHAEPKAFLALHSVHL
jgi:hypothetical protein